MRRNCPSLCSARMSRRRGGYWLACAGDEIFADESSVIGSIGVISAGFGFVDAIAKLGVERRVHASGESKSMLDPFKPEKPEDVAHLLSLQADVHQAFKDLVRSRRGAKLAQGDGEIFSGAFWSGRKAMAKGLIDGIGHLHQVLKQRYGDKVVVRSIAPAQGWGLKGLVSAHKCLILRQMRLRPSKRVHCGRVSAYDGNDTVIGGSDGCFEGPLCHRRWHPVVAGGGLHGPRDAGSESESPGPPDPAAAAHPAPAPGSAHRIYYPEG